MNPGHIDCRSRKLDLRLLGPQDFAAKAYRGLRFHDLRHQAITELAEAGATDADLMAVAGHMSRRMMEHYSHVRKAAKREMLAKLESGLMALPATQRPEPESKFLN